MITSEVTPNPLPEQGKSSISLKDCTKCYQSKPESEYNFRNKKKGTRMAFCKDCQHRYQAAYRDTRRAEFKASNKAWAQNNKDRLYEYHLKRVYGITLADYKTMVSAQDGRCACCGKEPKSDHRISNLSVDHCHESGVVRGLLCNKCNLILGYFESDHVSNILAYLFAHKSKFFVTLSSFSTEAQAAV